MLSSIESEDNERIPTLKALTIGWRLTYIDAGDDSDDLIVELPDDLLRATAWAEGDLLEMEAEADSADSSVIRVTKRTLCDACSVNTSDTAMASCRRTSASAQCRRRRRGHATMQVLLQLRDGHADARIATIIRIRAQQ